MGFAVELVHRGCGSLVLPQGSPGVQGESPKATGSEQQIWLLLQCQEYQTQLGRGKYKDKAEPEVLWQLDSWPWGAPRCLRSSARPSTIPCPPPASSAQAETRARLPTLRGNNFGRSCWGAKHPNLAILTPKLRTHSPSLHSQLCQKPPEPQCSNSSVCTARRATRLGVIHPLHSVNI